MKEQQQMAHPAIIRIDPAALILQTLDLDAAAFQSSLPVQNYSLVFEDATIGLAVGVWDTTTMQETFGPYPGDEFITVLEGQFAILDVNGAAVSGSAGQSACFRNAVPASWKQEGYLKKVYLTLQDPLAGTPSFSRSIPCMTVLEPATAFATARVRVGAPACETLFRNDTNTMTVTQINYAATRLPLAVSVDHQLIRVLAGAITLTDSSGHADHFGPDAHIFVPRGTRCAWHIADGTLAWHVTVTARAA